MPRLAAVLVCSAVALGCQQTRAKEAMTLPSGAQCMLVQGGSGNRATSVRVRTEEVASNLEVPWGLAWLPNGDLLVSERPGRVRAIRNGALAGTPILELAAAASGEGGLLGIALSPNVATNRRLFLYVTLGSGDAKRNEVQRWLLSEDFATAAFERVLLGDIPGASFHDGGRLRFGPDGHLYVGTGDAGRAALAQNPDSPAGKLLRVTEDGEPAPGNPFEGKAALVLGIRNTQGFDWFPGDPTLLAITDHGPSGESGRRGLDEVNVTRAGANLGWPEIVGCESREAMLTPSLTWESAVPPGGAAFYTGEAIAAWKGSLLIGVLGARHLHRVEFDGADPRQVRMHEVYFDQTLGRIREVMMGPDGHLYITTSNCDGRGACPATRDRVLRVVPDA